MKLSEVLQIEQLQTLGLTVHNATGLPIGVLDAEGKGIVGLGFEEICSRYHRACPASARRCAESDRYIQSHVGEGYVTYTCGNGMCDIAFPIRIHGEHVGAFITGQFFRAPPDEEEFRRRAVENGYDVEGYLAAMRKVQVVSEERFARLMQAMQGAVRLVTDLVEERLQRQAAEEKLRRALELVGQRAHERSVALHEATEALRQSVERYRTLIDLAPVGITVSQDRRYVFVNRAAVRCFGAPDEEAIIGTPFLERIHPDDRPVSMTYASALGAGGGPVVGIEHRLLRLDGTSFDAEVALVPSEWQGRPAVTAVLRDVTAQRHENAELRRLRQAVEATGEVIFLTDREGVITYVNPEFTRLYGWTADEVVGRVTPRILKSGKITEERYAGLWRTILGKRVARGAITNRTRDGRFVEADSSVSAALDEDGEIVGFLCIQRDVTERNRAAAEREALSSQLVRAQKMEAVGRLAGGVAHDFNNLLSVILGFSRFAIEQLAETDPLRQDIEEVVKAAQRGAGLARQLLIFSRKEIARPEPLDLNEVVANLEKMLHRTLGEDIHLVTVPGPDLCRVSIDPGQIDQVLVNMAVNSRDAMPDGGRLTLETANVELREADPRIGLPPGRYVRLTIADSGTGMTPEVAARAFEPFFTTKPAGQGTGLGLATVYGIVKRAGGDLALETPPGHGTRFEILLPALAEESNAPAPRPGPDGAGEARLAGHGETILVVEDEDAVRTLASRILLRAGYKVLDAANGGEALLLCERQPEAIDLLLTDVVMPNLSGSELAGRLRKLRSDLVVVYMSGYTQNSIVHGGVPDEGVRLVEKPFTQEKLLAEVRRALDEERGRS